MEDIVTTDARYGYEAYIASSGGLNYQGNPCPKWDDLPGAIQDHWRAATRQIAGSTRARLMGNVKAALDAIEEEYL